MKKLITSLSLCCSILTVSAQEEKVKTSTTTTTTVTQESGNDTTATVAPTAPAPVEVKVQDSDESSEWRGFHVGGLVQATFSDIDVDGANGALKTSYVVGYGGGGFIGYFFNRHAELRLAILYSSLAQEIIEDDIKRELKLSYVNIPLLFALHTGYNKPVSFHIAAGPQVGINTGSSLDGDGSSGVDTIQAKIELKAADIGFAYGAGFDFGFGPKRLIHLNIGFRGVYGIVDISDNSGTTTTDNYYIFDRAILKTYSGYAGLSVKF
ncbi:MAG: PorT family protein [Bacteroidota bacterium]|nr:PorT family protein [Bacteroidota bacterium]